MCIRSLPPCIYIPLWGLYKSIVSSVLEQQQTSVCLCVRARALLHFLLQPEATRELSVSELELSDQSDQLSRGSLLG